MRRIVIIATSMAGVTCATRMKRRLPESEINLVLPAAVAEAQTPCGPAGKRLAEALPNLEHLSSREIGILETNDIMPGLDSREITVSSSRGRLTVRYTDLVVEVPATVRIPRALQNAANVFGWPMSGFAAAPDACDNALAAAAQSSTPVVVVGSGMPALDALLLATESGAPVHWLHTAAVDTPDIEPHLVTLVLKHLGASVTRTALPQTTPDQLSFSLTPDSTALEHITLPDGKTVPATCCLWTTPLMARHPLLREDGVILDPFGRIEATEGAAASLNLSLMGNGASLPAAPLAAGAVHAPIYAGGDEAALASAAIVVEKLASGTPPLFPGLLGVRHASTTGMRICRAGITMAEAERLQLEAEHATATMPIASEGSGPAAVSSNSSASAQVILTLICHKPTQTIIGAQVLGLNTHSAVADGLFGMALAAMADHVTLDTLIQREATGVPGSMLARAASILRSKITKVIKGISPDEFVASRDAGAEFFTLDLRAYPEWEQGHLPDSHNIPLPQLKKRLQDEVPRFTPIVIVCATGNDAYSVACRLAGLGATELYVLDGGINLWPYGLEKV